MSDTRMAAAVCALGVVCAGLLGGGAALATGSGTGRVAPPDSRPYGKAYPQWAASWARWALEMPSTDSPFTDVTECHEAQHGRVWKLPIQFGPGARFHCLVPAGKALLVSPIGAVCSVAGGDATTDAGLRACARTIFPLVSRVRVWIDGRSVRHPLRWRFVSPVFAVKLPRENILGVSAGFTRAATGGWFYLVRPLARGAHRIDTLAVLQLGPTPTAVRFHYRLQMGCPPGTHDQQDCGAEEAEN